MKNKCYNHPDRRALSICHSCKRYFCEDCLVVGVEYYYCKSPECQKVYKREMPIGSIEASKVSLEELQKVSNYLLLIKALRWPAIGSIIFGIIAILMGVVSMDENPINVVLAIIGTFLLIEGIWVLFAPRPRGIIVEGIALLVVGVWNFSVSIANLIITAGASGGSPIFLALGVSQIVWGIQSFRRYPRFSGMSMTRPSKHLLKYVEDLLKVVSRLDSKLQTDVIEFKMNAFGKLAQWVGNFSQETVLLASTEYADVFFGKPENFSMRQIGKGHSRKNLKVELRIGRNQFKGTISQDNFERYSSWKTAIGVEQHEGA